MKKDLLELLQFVEKNNTFYSKKFMRQGISFLKDGINYDECFSMLNATTKDDYVKIGQDVVSDCYKECKLENQYTSGSTGIPLLIYKTQGEIFAQVHHLWKYRKETAEILPSDRYIRTHISERNGKNVKMDKIIRDRYFLSFNIVLVDDVSLMEYYLSFVDFEPKWILSGLSFMLLFSEFIVRHNLIIPHIEYIELTGEYVSQEQEDYLRSIWKCIVVNHYGCREAYAIALECKYGNLHILEENVIVEIEDNKSFSDGYGNILLTLLHSKSMPFIKYAIGDIGRIEKEKCLCGKKEKLTLLGGRKSDYFDWQGHRIHSSVFHYIIKVVNLKSNSNIIFFQISRLDINIVFQICLRDTSAFDTICKMIIAETSNVIKNAEVKVELLTLEKMSMLSSGKHRVI